MASEPYPLSGATDRLLSRIEQATGKPRRRQGREWRVLCPAHDDHTPSLDVREGDAGYPVVHCRSHGCSFEQVLQAVGWSWGDVFPEREMWTPHGTAVAVYDYHDEQGNLLYQVLRTAGKEFPCRVPDPSKPHGWRWSLNGVRRVPYRLPQLLAAIAAGEDVYVVEGEKDVQALERLGCTATCNPGGAGKWRDRYGYGLLFAGARVVVVADRDEAGYKHARDVAANLRSHAASVRVLRTSLDKKGADIADHVAAGLKLDELVPLELEALEGGAETAEPAPEEEPSRPPLTFLSGREFIEQPLIMADPLIGGDPTDAVLMPGAFALLAGVGGCGKSTLAIHAAAHWAAGLPWFGIKLLRPLRIVMIENEGPHDPFVLKVREFSDRFRDCPCCADEGPHGCGRDFLDNWRIADSPWGRFSWDDAEYAQRLRQEAVDFNADLVIANPLSLLGMKGVGSPDDTRNFMNLLKHNGLGEDFALMLIHHCSMPKPGATLLQQISGDWAGHPDLAIMLELEADRRSKLTFGKMRWGKQGKRPPLILDWLDDDGDGPIGYRVAEAPQGVTDAELYDRIDRFLADQEEPRSLTDIRKAVRGKAKRISALVRTGAAAGRYVSDGGGHPKFRLADSGDTQDELEWR